MSKPWYIFTSDHSGLPLATHLQDEGEDVTLVLIHPTRKNGKIETPKTPEETKQVQEKVKYLNKNGKGLIKKIWAPDAMGRIKKGAYVIWDQIYGFQYSEALYRRGVKVLGGSKIGFTLETERKQTLNLLSSMGFDVPKQHFFGPGSSKKVIEILKKDKDNPLYCFKSDASNIVTQVAYDSNDELIQKIQAESKGIDKDGCMLQEKVEGIEFNVETWFSKGIPILADIDIEAKKKYSELSEVQTGCAMDDVWTIPVDHPLRIRLNKPFDKFAAKYIGTGYLDISVIYDDKLDKMFALEVCGVRPGYNQIYTLLSQLKIPIGQFYRDFMDGKYTSDVREKVFNEGFGASLRVFNDSNTADQMITFPEDQKQNYWIWDCYKEGGQLKTTGGEHGEALGIITGTGENPESANARLRQSYFKLQMSTKFCRDRFDEDDDVNLPLSRYHQMKRLGLI